MVINKDFFKLCDTFSFKVSEQALIKLEDAVRKDKGDLLITIAASHYGMRNRNWTVYRHDTVKHDIDTFVAPFPRPIIEKHNPKSSQVFGKIVAADYRLTPYHDKLIKHTDSDFDTESYINFVKGTLLPLQKKDPRFDGLAYLELTGKVTHKDGIQKILDKEFLTVSIGAIPLKLVCSECGKDQVVKICDHYGSKHNDTFMLSESLEYEELSFVNKPADPFGRILHIHDGVVVDEKIFEAESSEPQEAQIDFISVKDFFEQTADDKTIVCVNNICTVLNSEDSMKKKQEREITTVSLKDEFGEAKVKELVDAALELPADLADNQFAIVQKTSAGIKRRFPVCDENQVKAGIALLKDAEDLTEQEKERAVSVLKKAAKKFGVDASALDLLDEETTTEEGSTEEESSEEATHTDSTEGSEEGADNQSSEEEKVVRVLDEVLAELKDCLEATEAPAIQDDGEEKPNPMGVVFAILSSIGSDLEWAGKGLRSSVDSYLKSLGEQALKDEEVARMTDQVTELESEIELLDSQNQELNYQLRTRIIDEIVATKKIVGLLEDSEEAEKAKYEKLGYDALCVASEDFRKIGLKIKDQAVTTNTVDIKTVQDPTLTDSVQDEEETNGTEEPAVKPLSRTEAVALIKSLRRNAII